MVMLAEVAPTSQERLHLQLRMAVAASCMTELLRTVMNGPVTARPCLQRASEQYAVAGTGPSHATHLHIS